MDYGRKLRRENELEEKKQSDVVGFIGYWALREDTWSCFSNVFPVYLTFNLNLGVSGSIVATNLWLFWNLN